ncbi:DUF1707 SHOCT-like domain-containing protein [Geodermatophilus sp. SYSU D00766]
MSGSGTPSPAPPLRAADSDRVATVQVLQDAVARGLLTLEEGGERMAAAFAAVHLRDLVPLTADLPPAPARPGAPGWRPLGLMAWEQLRTTMTDARTGRPAAVRIALVTVLTLIALLLVAALVLHGLADPFDGPDGFRGGPPEGFRGGPG